MLVRRSSAMRSCAKGLETGSLLQLQDTNLWKAHGQCENPVDIFHQGYRAGNMLKKYPEMGMGEKPIEVLIFAPCRKCKECLAARGRLWRDRAQNEYGLAVRTWMVTLTISPNWHEQFRLRTVQRLSLGGVDYDAMCEGKQFAARCQPHSVEITKWLKRIRKRSGAPLRYLVITEKHKSGLPHHHALVHEQDPMLPIRYNHYAFRRGDHEITSWPFGYASAKLIETQQHATYVCKYLSKQAETRVRASLAYGRSINQVKNVKIDPKNPATLYDGENGSLWSELGGIQ